ncbi:MULTISPECIES: TRAP transporter substrate-binding protein [unclassified Marinobacterium]|jgi:TRAP-type transport system periplasmic protein|uniref:TRAP transporter substrate-binding protein n=1 Tax=unclassified Marinobacterium TaxID=2644139 RepID=UPI001A0CA32A|nr:MULTISPECIES: TRAP transporter substrate-binding protein [unclassified Marinobacterium]NRP09158.1 2,3-diketo-L-gulonate-binding periplasmic protein YiaO precursor [Marinobacterium sp. xm-g-48]NRP15438.1 2,3-diketo-L-gulonate-binding periplasmic protein YiaO precursor [Marinobacterium sp. xm-a-152]NRP26472.1 2,3-diketo-L-gulonate-binding periplasmic protein YiaO precursor [Marinobacterium sp. xm-d-420]NRP35745.1 2,3-diketo-L-gulonate-binding periplasmic protein YiaO precursor [Marinobacterium
MIKRIIAQTAGVAVLGAAIAASAQAAEFNLKMHHFLPAKAPAHAKFFQPWADSIEEASEGRIKIKIYGSMSLGGKPPQLVDQVQDGFVDIIWTLPGYTPGRFPAISAFENPFMVTDAYETSQALQAYYEANPEVQKEFADMHPLAFWTHDRGVVYSKGDAIDSVADFAGKKIRNPSRPVAAALDALGATPVGMPVPEMPQALAKNVIDGTVIPFEIVPALKLHELVDNAVEVQTEDGRGLYTAVFLLGMNKAKYESMPADLQQIMDDHAGMYFAKLGGEFFKNAENYGRKLIDENATRSQMPAAEVKKMQEVTANVPVEWVKEMDGLGLPGQKLLDSANAMLEKYSK